MNIQIVSDLHLESPKAYDFYEIIPTAPYLALLGDIGCVCDPGFLAFLIAQLKQFSIVFHVLGNHEPYGPDWHSVIAKLLLCQEENRSQRATISNSSLGEYVFLNSNEYRLPEYDITILGCTLFSYVPEVSLQDVSFGLNDFFRIDSWTVEEHVSAHKSDLAWLNSRVSALSKEDHKIVIFTHHSPTVDPRTVNPRTARNKISSGFATDLRGETCWVGKNVVFWGFGHTHYNFRPWRDEESGTFFYSNQRGVYFSQASGFAEKGVVEIGSDGRVVVDAGAHEHVPPQPGSPAKGLRRCLVAFSFKVTKIGD